MLKFQRIMQYCIDEYYNSFSLLFKGLIDIDKCAERKYNYRYTCIRLKLLYETLTENKIKNHRDVSKYYSYSGMKLSCLEADKNE